MPEETNRVLTDHVSQLLFCPTQTAVDNLQNEGINKGIHLTGDVMFDAFKYYSHSQKLISLMDTYDLPPRFCLATLHRAENTEDKNKMTNILTALAQINKLIPIILPMHPRTQAVIDKYCLSSLLEDIHTVAPVSYLAMLSMLNKCELVLTDSGGLQKEAYFARKPCITMRDETEWLETLGNSCNVLTGADNNKILAMTNLALRQNELSWPEHFGSGNAGELIVSKLCTVI